MIKYNIAGEAELRRSLERLPRTIADRLYAALDGIRGRPEAAVKGAEPARTGALRASTTSFISRSGDRINIGVEAGGDSGKAGALEYGSHKVITVRLARRSRMAKRLRMQQLKLVEAYQRHTNISARRYLRGPFDVLEPDIVAELEAGISEAIVAEELDAAAEVAGIEAAQAAAARF